MTWDSTVTGYTPEVWLKMDDGTTATTGTDSSGNGWTVEYPNGTFTNFPERHLTGLISGSTYSLQTGGGGNNELRIASTFAQTFLTGGDWTFGLVIKATTTSATTKQFGVTAASRAIVALNHNINTTSTSDGAISILFDQNQQSANALVASSTGWNDGDPHLLMFTYDATADEISIWMDGSQLASKSLAAVTKPTVAGLTGGAFYLAGSTGLADVWMDEFVAFTSAFGSTEHTALYDAAFPSTVDKSDSDSATLTDSGSVVATTSKADTDSATLTDNQSITAVVSKSSTDSATVTDYTATRFLRTTDQFIVTDADYLNYALTAPLTARVAGHRTYLEVIADGGTTATPPAPTRTYTIASNVEALEARLYDPGMNPVDLTAFSGVDLYPDHVTFDIGTPGEKVHSATYLSTLDPDDDVYASLVFGDTGLISIDIPGGLVPGIYSVRATINTGTAESPIYRSYPTEAITLEVTD